MEQETWASTGPILTTNKAGLLTIYGVSIVQKESIIYY